MSEELVEDNSLLDDDDEEPITAQKVSGNQVKAHEILQKVKHCTFSCLLGATKFAKYMVK